MELDTVITLGPKPKALLEKLRHKAIGLQGKCIGFTIYYHNPNDGAFCVETHNPMDETFDTDTYISEEHFIAEEVSRKHMDNMDHVHSTFIEIREHLEAIRNKLEWKL